MVQTMQPVILALSILFPAISTIFIALRIWIRVSMKAFAADDALALGAWVLAVAYAGVAYVWIKVNWFGYHVWDIPKPDIATNVLSMKLNMAQQLLYNPILCLVKASAIVFLLRLGDNRKVIRWSLHIFFWYNLGHMISVFFAALTQCLPVHMYWDHYYTDEIVNGVPVNPNYSCFQEEIFSLTTAGLAILSDILILVIPIAMMWNLRLDPRKKIAVGVVMSLGWIVCVISIIRLKVFYDYWTGASDDPTWGLSQTVSGIEVNVAIWTCCGPAMKAILTRFSPKFFGSRTGSRPSRHVYYAPNGYELSGRGGQEKSGFNTNYSAVVHRGARDDDASSQDAIIRDENLVINKTREVRVDFEVEQPAASHGRSHELSRRLSQYGR